MGYVNKFKIKIALLVFLPIGFHYLPELVTSKARFINENIKPAVYLTLIESATALILFGSIIVFFFLLLKVLRLIPTAFHRLRRILRSNYPHKQKQEYSMMRIRLGQIGGSWRQIVSIPLITSVLFMIILVLSCCPLIIYLELFTRTLENHLNGFWITILLLVCSNLALYYYSTYFYWENAREKRRLYVISAPFKGQSQFSTMLDFYYWMITKNIRPIFFHLISFTLFSDLLLRDLKGRSGIVGLSFTTYRESASISEKFLLVIFVIIWVSIFLKLLLELPANLWEKRHIQKR